MRVEWTTDNDPPEVKRYLHDYELEGAQSREARMHAWPVCPMDKGLARCADWCDLKRRWCSRSPAAVALLGSPAAADPASPAVIETVRKSLAGCKRPSAAWLLAWTRLGREPTRSCRSGASLSTTNKTAARLANETRRKSSPV